MELAAAIGTGRGALQQIAALEMLANQRSGQVAAAQAWRDVVTLPAFANADEGGLLLQQPPDQVRQPGVTNALAKEYVGWQVTRTRQIFDALQHTMQTGAATDAYVQSKLAEIDALVQFPPSLLEAAGVKPHVGGPIPLPALAEPLNSPEALATLAAWREKVEATLPNLLSPTDVTRLQRPGWRASSTSSRANTATACRTQRSSFRSSTRRRSSSRSRRAAWSTSWRRCGAATRRRPMSSTTASSSRSSTRCRSRSTRSPICR